MIQIKPITDLRNTTEISDLCHSRKEPIFITKNGYGDMVIMSIAAYENHIARMKIYDKIMQGAQQAEEGKLIDGDSAMASLRSKYVR